MIDWQARVVLENVPVVTEADTEELLKIIGGAVTHTPLEELELVWRFTTEHDSVEDAILHAMHQWRTALSKAQSPQLRNGTVECVSFHVQRAPLTDEEAKRLLREIYKEEGP